MKSKSELDKWRKADEIYQSKIQCIETNMDRRDISCSHYNHMLVSAIEEAGLGKHTSRCSRNGCSDDCPSHAK